MKWPKWSIAKPGSGDFLPIMIGVICLLISLPAFVMVLFNSDRHSEPIAGALLVVLGGGIIIGTMFVILGLRICSYPGSRIYRITHGRFWC